MVDFARERGRSSRDDDRGSSRGRDDDRGSRGRDRDESRGSERGSRDSGRGGREREPSRATSGASRSFSYQGRDRGAVDKRANQSANDFDRFIKDGINQYVPRKGENHIRIICPTWPKPEHYGWDLYVHYGVGPDRQSYLDLQKMKDERDPITEEREALRKSGDADDQELKDMDSKKRVGVYLIDRKEPEAGVQFWAMPWTVDRDISVISIDKETGGVINIDDPEEGYDIYFKKEGEKRNTKYSAFEVARRSSPLGKAEWLDFAVENPIPEQLVFFSYDDIAKAFGSGGAHRERDREEEGSGRGRDERPAGRDAERDGGRGRDDRSGGRERQDSRGRDDGRDSGRDEGGRERGGRDRDRTMAEPAITWESVHAMTPNELDALCSELPELKGINPNDAASDDELVIWICEDLKLEKPSETTSTRRRVSAPDPEAEDKLARMREERDGSRRGR